MKKKLKILLADDHPMVRTGMMTMLEQVRLYDSIITEVEDGLELISLLEKETFDILLLDISLPGKDGISIIKYCRNNDIQIPILVISMHKEPHIVKQAVDSGAQGYLNKSCGVEELGKAIKAVLNYKPYYGNDAAQALLTKTSRKRIENDSSLITNGILTEREKVIITLIAKEMTSIQIAEKLNISRRTVDSHRAKVIAKLQVKNTAGLIHYATKNGLVD